MRKPTILVVDPSPSQQATLAAALRGHGYAVMDARSADEALRLAVGEAPDLILGEHPLLLGDGRPLCAALRSDADTAAIPFLALTARAMPDEVESARHAHPAGVLLKPVSRDRLLERVRKALAAVDVPSNRARATPVQ